MARPFTILSVVGARPNFMKVAPIVAQLQKRPDLFTSVIVHTGQHYDEKLSKVFFDDLGCLRDHLSKNRQALPAGTVAFVADFRTRAWVRAADAVFTRPQGLATPMGGQIIAHESPGSRDDDPAAKGGTPVAPAAIFGGDGPPNGGRP